MNFGLLHILLKEQWNTEKIIKIIRQEQFNIFYHVLHHRKWISWRKIACQDYSSGHMRKLKEIINKNK